MKSRDESEILRRRADAQRDAMERSYQAPASFGRPGLYVVTIGDEDGAVFPATGLNTVFAVAMLGDFPADAADAEGSVVSPGEGGAKFTAVNLGEGLPVQDQTIVRCDSIGGQLFFAYRGNGSAT